MKKLLFTLLTMLALTISGCGDGSVAVFIPIGPASPELVLNQFTKDRVAEFVDGSVEFYAPDVDLDTMTVAVYDSLGGVMSRTTKVLDYPHTVRGMIPFSIDYLHYPADRYYFIIYVTDFNGNTSNLISDTFSVP